LRIWQGTLPQVSVGLKVAFMENSEPRDDDATAMHGHKHAGDWDERYEHHDHQRWSGEPNGVLLAEIAGETPGSALDVGCGEGADAVWLALQGWQVTAVDVSQVALDRGATAADEVDATVDWVCADVVTTPPTVGAYDLVSVQYPALPHSPDDRAIRSLLAAVAPGGILLVVGHGASSHEYARSQGFDPAMYIEPADVAAHLDDNWVIEIDETRQRTTSPSHGSPHSHDIVLRARRRSNAKVS